MAGVLGVNMKYIVFKNTRGTIKISVELSNTIESLAHITNKHADIIKYFCDNFGYSWNLERTKPANVCVLSESILNI